MGGVLELTEKKECPLCSVLEDALSATDVRSAVLGAYFAGYLQAVTFHRALEGGANHERNFIRAICRDHAPIWHAVSESYAELLRRLEEKSRPAPARETLS